MNLRLDSGGIVLGSTSSCWAKLTIIFVLFGPGPALQKENQEKKLVALENFKPGAVLHVL